MDESRNTAAMVRLSGKSETLSALTGLLQTGHILPQLDFTVSEWRNSKIQILERLTTVFRHTDLLAVRSSCQDEDNDTRSNAGAFLSELSVPKDDVAASIDRVVDSYPKDEIYNAKILIQEMLTDVTYSGVAFSHVPASAAPYFVINYHVGNDTTVVTAGKQDELETIYHFRSAQKCQNPTAQRVLDLIRELETLTGIPKLDVEFAHSKSLGLCLLQVRQLVAGNDTRTQQVTVGKQLELIAEKINRLNAEHPYLLGKKTVLGVMPDWNPAEIIGTRPQPLAMSLYRSLITDAVWAYQRNNYGYRNLRSFPLLISLGGQPYIDVRVSFNSFIPADIDDKLASKLVNYYLDTLAETPNLHDKVEFEIIFSCYTLDLPQRIERLKRNGFSAQQCKKIAYSLKKLTNRIVNPDTGLILQDLEKIEKLKERQTTVLNSNLSQFEKIYWLIEDCKRYGTLPFAGLARAGFIAVQLLKSLLHLNVINQYEYDNFLSSVETISHEMKVDLAKMKREAFLEKYGHLRPGTYNITSPRYDEAPETYFPWQDENQSSASEAMASPGQFRLTIEQMRTVDDLLKSHGLEMDVVQLFDFIRTGITAREMAKFVFTKSISDMMKILSDAGVAMGLTAADLSFLDISDLEKLHATSLCYDDEIRHSINKGKRHHALSDSIHLPPFIRTIDDIYTFNLPSSTPNFITRNTVEAEVVMLTDSPGCDQDLDGKIVAIQNADPGFDWIFTRKIAGLITAYGGANSHMAIRSSEFGIPAVIGAGKDKFEHWAGAKALMIDCSNQLVLIRQ